MKLDWNKMSGRERDALVAERIMGWRRLTVGEYLKLAPEDFTDDYHKSLTDSWHAADGIEAVAPINQECDCGQSHENFSPSTDIKDAWLVVERMRGKGWRVRLDDSGTKWIAVFRDADSFYTASAPTAPEAICLAACRAEGVEV